MAAPQKSAVHQCFLFLIGSLCYSFDVLLAFDNFFMPPLRTDDASSAYTNDHDSLKGMPHSPTAAEEFPYEFWHENRPFGPIHGDRQRHQHFAVDLYFNDAFGNFITDPPGVGLNAMGQAKMKPGREDERSFGRNGDKSSGRKTDDEQSFLGNPFSASSIINRVGFEKIPPNGKGIGHEDSPSSLSTVSSPSAAAAVIPTHSMKPILRFYHRPKSDTKSSKPSFSLPAIIVPASFSTVEHSVDSAATTTEHRHTTTQSSIIDADIPFIEPADLKDAQPIEIPTLFQPQQQQNDGLGPQRNYGHRGGSAENGQQPQKQVLKTDESISTTTVPYASVPDTFDHFELGTTAGAAVAERRETALPCAKESFRCCDKCSTAPCRCPSPKKYCCCCCCASTDRHNGAGCANCNGQNNGQPPSVVLNLWLSIRCCCCDRHRSIQKFGTLKKST